MNNVGFQVGNSNVSGSNTMRITADEDQSADYTITVPGPCRLLYIDIYFVSGTPTVSAAYTVGGYVLLPDTALTAGSPVATISIMVPQRDDTDIDINISGGVVNVNTVYLANYDI